MITKKQKQFLKGIANTLKPTVMIGKDGLTENIIISTEEYLTAHEIVKISVLQSCETEINELVLDLIAETKSELVCQLGKKIVLYKRNSKNPQIYLPK